MDRRTSNELSREGKMVQKFFQQPFYELGEERYEQAGSSDMIDSMVKLELA